jgi:hypothetical protein
VQRDAGPLLYLETKQVRQGGLRALDLGGRHGFVANVGAKKERRIREQQPDAVQTTESDGGVVVMFFKLRV